MSKAAHDNHANQLNPNNDAYWESRGCEERPDDWLERVDIIKQEHGKNEGKDNPRKGK